MSAEREFLKKLRYASLLENDLRKELDELLSQPEQEQEPVAWKDRTYGNLHHVDYGNSIPLYTAPPKREPLSDDTMLRLITEHRYFPPNLVRAIEKAHGIGGGE